MSNTVSVLLVEDSSQDADYIQINLRKAENTRFSVDHVEWLSSAITAVEHRTYDIILLDLSLPDTHGIDTLVRFMEAESRIPIIIMTGHDDMETAMWCMKYGAQDFQFKGDIKPRPLERAILYAIERKQHEQVSKKLLRASVSQFTSADANKSPTSVMLKGHIQNVAESIEEILAYLRRNAPHTIEDVTSIMRSHEIEAVLREMREIIRCDEEPGGRNTEPPVNMPGMAHQTLSDFKPPRKDTPSDRPSAEKTLLAAINELSESGEGDDG